MDPPQDATSILDLAHPSREHEPGRSQVVSEPDRGDEQGALHGIIPGLEAEEQADRDEVARDAVHHREGRRRRWGQYPRLHLAHADVGGGRAGRILL